MKQDEIKKLNSRKADLTKQIEALQKERATVSNTLYNKIDVPKAKSFLGKHFARKGRSGNWDVFRVTGNDGALITGTNVRKSVSPGKYGNNDTRINRKSWIEQERLSDWKEISATDFNNRVAEMLEL